MKTFTQRILLGYQEAYRKLLWANDIIAEAYYNLHLEHQSTLYFNGN